MNKAVSIEEAFEITIRLFKDLQAENQKLKDIIAKSPSENDDLGAEYVHVQILKESLNDSFRILREIATEDYRGNRPSGSVKAYNYLKSKGEL